MSRKGRLFVISAPSGAGKSTLCQRLIKSSSGKRKLVQSISATTRTPRKGECQGRDYFFISLEEFFKRRKQGYFLEWAQVLDNFYATPRTFVQEHLKRGDDVLLNIDVQGAMKISRKIKGAVLIFILPPSLRELQRRLGRRQTESKREMARRLQLAKKEVSFIKRYNYIILNDQINSALVRLKKIVRSAKKRDSDVLCAHSRFVK